MTRILAVAFCWMVATLASDSISQAQPLAKTKANKNKSEVVFLHEGRDFSLLFGKQTYQGLLARELARQALLIAAREELSCTTRDVHLGQKTPADNGLELDLLGVAARPSRLELFRGGPPTQSLIASEELRTGEEVDFVWLITEMESRSRDSFVKHLQKAGVKGEPRPWKEDATLEPEVSKLLQEMNFVTQWQAACNLHAEIANGGASPTVVAALARAYANLGVLTELHWAPAHKVFTARSLLYAERLVASNRNPKLALGTRAYANALAGLTLAALADLDALKKLSENRQENGLPALLRAYCRFQHDDLSPHKYAPGLYDLATMLGYLAKNYSKRANEITEAALFSQQSIPHCYRIIIDLGTMMIDEKAPAIAVKSFKDTSRTLYPRISNLPKLPAAAFDAAQLGESNLTVADGETTDINFAKEIKARSGLIAALAAANERVGNQDELDWLVLSRLIAEHSFCEIWQLTHSVKKLNAASMEDWLDVARPLYEKHPYAPVINALSEDLATSRRASIQAASIDLDSCDVSAFPLANVPSVVGNFQHWSRSIHEAQRRHMDETACDLARLIQRGYRNTFISNKIFAITPDSSLARLAMIESDWEKIQANLPEWEKFAENDPQLLSALSQQYFKEKKYDKFADAMKKVCKLQPSVSNFHLLARGYQAAEQMDLWQSAMEESLPLISDENFLQRAQVLTTIAHRHMIARDWKAAVPFAERSAESFAAWTLKTAAECHEALQNWEQAEHFYSTASKQYGNLWWLCFTKRTGKGDANAAETFSRSLLSGPNKNQFEDFDHYQFALSLGRVTNAVTILELGYSRDADNAQRALHLALLYDEQGEKEKRDAILKRAYQGDARKPAPRVNENQGLKGLAELLSKDLAADGQATFPEKEVDAIREKINSLAEHLTFDYILAHYYELHGKPAEAKRSYLSCMARIPIESIDRTAAGIRLLALGIGPDAYREALQTKPAPQKPKAN